VRFHLEKFNENLFDLERRWTDARPIELYIAFVMCDYDVDVTRERLLDRAFTRVVRAEVAAIGFGRPRPRAVVKEATPNSEEDWERERGQNGRGDSRQISSPERDEDMAEGRVTFIKGRRRFQVGGWRPM
jgi:hypothetical protein